MISLVCIIVFFFSSRRRHTRCSRDWSSDVCSSDLLRFLVSRPSSRWCSRDCFPCLPTTMSRCATRSENCRDRKSTRLNSSHGYISYAVFCLKKKKQRQQREQAPHNDAHTATCNSRC